MVSPNLHNNVYDGALDVLATSNIVHACTAEPANQAGIAAVTVGNYVLTAGDGGGDWTIADGDTSGRKLTLGAQSGNNATGTGAALFLAFSDGVTLLGVIDGSGETLNSGSPWTLAALDVVEMADPINE